MSHETPAAKRARLLDAFPELHRYGAPALLLHPHLADPRPQDSSVGGPLLWPSDEPWPTCDLIHHTFSLTDGSAEERPEEPVALHPVLQLFARDLPEGHSLPGNAELLHVLWCPNDHPEPPDADGHGHTPWLTLRLRQSLEGLSPLREQPRPHTWDRHYELPPCALAIEEITDYPTDEELPEELAERIREWEDDVPQTGHVIPKPSYFYDVAHRRGMKLGGFQRWSLTDAFPVECDCGSPTEYLFQIQSMEAGGLEGLVIGRGYSLGVHVCQKSLAHPHRTVMQ
ncbi:hypothetical protein SUDANB121_04597 [Nocardiopsis dassonvillei]|uniref:hypothetical protein n=1 Tax=Nocardiopsis dassonvillei TaxID=2014 RepID=UPI003F544B99